MTDKVMSKSVLNLSINDSPESLYTKLNIPSLKYVHLDHSHIDNSGKSIIQLAYEYQDIKNKLIILTNLGFLTYVLRDGVSSFVHVQEIRNLWVPVKDGRYSCDPNNIVYEYNDASVHLNKKLLVIFSQIPLDPYSPSLNRYFARNFSTIEKYIGKDVAILRIADLGGITGAFYLNTIGLPQNEKNIQKLISRIALDNGITNENIVLYGTSKGGTAAFYHGLQCGYKSVIVDPILNDHYYITKCKDLHLIENVFPEDKFSIFNKLLEDFRCNINKMALITSENSEQFNYILEVVKPYKNLFLFLNNVNPDIKKHPEVGPNSLHAITALINMAFIGVKHHSGASNFV